TRRRIAAARDRLAAG
ncbi:hypothetical protein, partial [Frankia sp. AvcI1]